MATNDYKFFPNSGMDNLTKEMVKRLGIYAGDRYRSDTTYWEIMYGLKRDNPKVKYCFYKYDANNYYIIFACEKDSTSNTKMYYGEYSKLMPSGDENYASIETDWNYDAVTAPGIMWTSSYVLFTMDSLPDHPPIYNTRAEALEAMDDNIWEEKDKYDGGGYSHPGGGPDDTWGEGSLFDHSSDPIDFSNLPDDIAVDSSMLRLYLPTKQQLSDFADFLWSNAFDISQLKKLWSNPMDYIVGLQALPFTVTDGGSRTCRIGNISTGVTMNIATKQFIEKDMGSLLLKPFWNSYLDAEPYTTIQIFLPFIGYRTISADDSIGEYISLKYQIDLVSGACIAQVKIGDTLRYTFSGQCSATVPLQSRDWINAIGSYVSLAGQIASVGMGNVSPANVTGIVQSAMGVNKPTIQRSGAFSGTSGFMGCKEPHIVITRPVQALPQNQNKLEGYPSFIYELLGSCEGFTAIETWKPEGVNCSQGELDQITELLKEGIFI